MLRHFHGYNVTFPTMRNVNYLAYALTILIPDNHQDAAELRVVPRPAERGFSKTERDVYH
jgi:hypothetical protein